MTLWWYFNLGIIGIKCLVIPTKKMIIKYISPDITSYPQAENQPHILALSVFADTQSQR